MFEYQNLIFVHALLDTTACVKSLTYNEKSKGTKIEPCGTPTVTSPESNNTES